MGFYFGMYVYKNNIKSTYFNIYELIKISRLPSWFLDKNKDINIKANQSIIRGYGVKILFDYYHYAFNQTFICDTCTINYNKLDIKIIVDWMNKHIKIISNEKYKDTYNLYIFFQELLNKIDNKYQLIIYQSG